MSDQSEMEEVIVEFLIESKEGLDRVDDDLLVLEKDPSNREPLASIFRAVHTIKGTAGFLGYDRLQTVAHAGESLLSLLRDGELVFNPDIATALFATVDALREMLAQIESTRKDGRKDYSAIVATLMRLLGDPAPDVPETASASPAPSQAAPGKAIAADVRAPLPSPVAAPVIAPPTYETSGDSGANDGASARPGASQETSVRVDVALLDKLMNLVGELVLGRNQILQFADLHHDPAFQVTSQRLNLITTELQENVMKTRMQPIGNVLHKFPRLVRDLALQCRKQIRVEIEGENTELDRTLLEAIRDPLTHAVRNAVDHGVELPGVRQSRGKDPEGRLQIRAYHQGGQVTIEISDDGAGINAERVREKALSRGLITAEQAERMEDRELVNLIFLPGFSTAEKVSNISGRGVGMDVVRTNVERVGGTVDIASTPGKGATIRIRLPLTLAIIPALIVVQDGERYAIPQVNLVELVRLEGDQARRGLEQIHDTPVYRLRGQLLPLIFLDEMLSGSGTRTADPLRHGVVNIVVLAAEDRQFGLVVERIADTAEIVVKPLGKVFKSTSLFAGATIMGDGAVALILDAAGVAQRVGATLGSERATRAVSTAETEAAHEDAGLLLCDLGTNRSIGIPLDTVVRLEEIGASAIERLGGEPVMQYRGDILRLVDPGNLLDAASMADPDAPEPLYHVVACRAGRKHQFGLLVKQIREVVENAHLTPSIVPRTGILGSMVIQGRLVEVMDVVQFAASIISFPDDEGEVAA